MKSTKEVNVIFDGQCDFCIRSLELVRACDRAGLIRFHDAHDQQTFIEFAELQGADVENAMYAVAEGEPPYRGYFAFRRLLWTNPLFKLLLPLFYFPGTGWAGPWIYSAIAQNRTRLGCRSGFCALPATSKLTLTQRQGQSARL